jgi:hypothetical protein
MLTDKVLGFELTALQYDSRDLFQRFYYAA